MWWYGLLVWLSVVMWGVQTVDLDQVHHLCQAREFHSFRRNVCSISKRSTTPGEANTLRPTYLGCRNTWQKLQLLCRYELNIYMFIT